MDRLERTSQKSPAPQGVSRRRRKREKRYLSSHLLGDGDRRRIRAPAKSCGQENAACRQRKAGCSILPPQAPQSLLLSLDAGPPAQPFTESASSPLMARSRASTRVWISVNLTRARSALSRSNGAASTLACASRSSIIRSRAFFSVSSRSLISGSCFHIRTPPRVRRTSVKGRRKPAIAKDHGRFVVIVAHLGGGGGRERNDAEFVQGQSFR